MKEEFFGFYPPTKEEVSKAWAEGTFIFDANALLNLYRYSNSTRKDFLLAIEKLKDRLFMPYQVGVEFHSNRHSVIKGLEQSYDALYSGMVQVFDTHIKEHFNKFKRHPSIDLDNLVKLQDEFTKKVSVEISKKKKSHPNFVDDDEVLDRLTNLYIEKVGPAFTQEELKGIFVEGKERYEKLTPPGYKDQDTKRKKGEQNVYGDLIIWKQIISYTIKEKKAIVFVTDDRKEDWWTIENGKTIRPREELVKEFYDLTRVRILIYSADQFLSYAKERKLVTIIKDTSISEIEEVRKSDENEITIADIVKSSELAKYQSSVSDLISKNIGSAAIANSDLLRAAAAVQASSSLANVFNSDALRSIVSFSTDAQKLAAAVSAINPSLVTSAKIVEYMNAYKPITLEGAIHKMNDSANDDRESIDDDK